MTGSDEANEAAGEQNERSVTRRSVLRSAAATVAGGAALTATATDSSRAASTQGIEPGVYKIKNVHSGKVLDSPEGANVVHQWDWHGGDNQRWKVKSGGKGYVIENVYSGAVLDVGVKNAQYYNKRNGLDVRQRDRYLAANPYWIFQEKDDGNYKIINRNTSKVLDVAGYSTDNGGNIHQWAWHGDGNQRWELERLDDQDETDDSDNATSKVDEGEHHLQNAKTYEYLNAVQGNYGLKTDLKTDEVYTPYFVPRDDGTYLIEDPENEGAYLGAPPSSQIDYPTFYEFDGSDLSEFTNLSEITWEITAAGEDGYRIRNPDSGKVLAVEVNEHDDNYAILKEKSGSENEVWYLNTMVSAGTS